MINDVIKIGTRRSKLALAQSKAFAERLEKSSGMKTRLIGITTEGDATKDSLVQIGGTGVFVTAIRQALMRGDVDLAVHSFKDLPVAPEPGLSVVTVPTRADVRDVLCTSADLQGFDALAKLPHEAVIGTGSPRRAVQLRALLGTVGRDDVEIQDIRGNVDTRLEKMYRGEVQGIVLAAAGLSRLGKTDAINMYFDPSDMVPAAGQGALAVEMRTDVLDGMIAEYGSPDRGGPDVNRPDPTCGRPSFQGVTELHPLLKGLAELDDSSTRLAVAAERAVLARLDVGCAKPVGVYATVTADLIEVSAVAAVGDIKDFSRPQRLVYACGRTGDRKNHCVDDAGATSAGINVAEQLIFQGVRYGD